MTGATSRRQVVTVIGGLLAAILLLGALGANLVVATRLVGDHSFLGAATVRDIVLATVAALVAVSVFLCVVGPRARVVSAVTTTFLSVAVVAVTTILTDNVVSAGMALVTLVACLGLGLVVLWTLRTQVEAYARAAVAIGAGFAVLTWIVRAAGSAGLANAWVIAVPVLVGGVATAAYGWRRVWPERRGLVRDCVAVLARPAPAVAVVCGAATAGVISIWTAAPELQYDALSAKEWLPRLWAHQGEIFIPPETPQMFVTGSALDAFLPGHTVGGDSTGRYTAFFVGIALSILVWRLVRPWVSPGSAAILAAMVLATPHVLWQMTTAFDDLELALVTLGVAAAAVGMRPLGPLEGVVMGLLAGSAVNAKLHLAVFAGVVACVWLLRADGTGRRIRVAGGCLAGGLVIAGAFLIARWIEFGNPVLPALNAIFRSEHYPPINESYNFPFAPNGGFGALLSAVPDFVLSPTTYVEATPPGAFALLPIVLVIYLAVGWRFSRPGGVAVWAGTLLAVVAWWVEVRYLRYLMPYFVVSLVMIAPFVGRLEAITQAASWDRSRYRLRAHRATAAALIVGAMFVAVPAPVLASFWNVPERLPLDVVFGAETRDEYRLRAMPGVAAVDAINELTPDGSLIVMDPVLVYQRTLLEGRRNLLPIWEFVTITQWLAEEGKTGGPLDSVGAWRSRGVSWAALSRSKLEGGEYDPRVTAVVENAGRVVWSKGDIVLVEIGRG